MLRDPEIRKAIYGLTAAASVLFVFYGVATQDEATMWTGLVQSAVNLMAVLNTSGGTEDEYAPRHRKPEDA